jgi:2-polyprenyl-3-methyl-5-hydroxy-6-metoxy-1,4-benzoquinol methylase
VKERMNSRLRELYEEIGDIQEASSHLTYDGITHDKLITDNVPSGKTCLDLGCGDGHYMNVLEDRFDEVIGVDIARSKVAKAKRRANKRTSCFVVADSCKLPFAGGVYDFVLFTEVIEHLPDPSEGILEITRCLKTNGKALITTPNFAEPMRFVLYTILSLLQKTTGQGFMNQFKSSSLKLYNSFSKDTHKEQAALKYGIPEHFNCFSVKYLQKLCKDARLEAVRLDYSRHQQILFPLITLANRYDQLIKLCFSLGNLIPKQCSTIFALVCVKRNSPL